MKTIKIGKSIAAAILTLGVIHNIATFTPIIKNSLSCLPPAEFDFMLYMSLMCGSSLIISGLILLVLLNKVIDYQFLINPILIIGIFLGLNGFLLLFFSHNIFDNIFAVIGLLLNLSMCSNTIILLIKLKHKAHLKRWYNYL